MGFKFNNGDEVKDRTTGFIGIIRARGDYLTGCNRYGVQSIKLKDNKPADWVWFDEAELILIQAKKINLDGTNPDQKSKKKLLGGPLSKNQYPNK